MIGQTLYFFPLAFLKREFSRVLSQCLTHKNGKLNGISPDLIMSAQKLVQDVGKYAAEGFKLS